VNLDPISSIKVVYNENCNHILIGSPPVSVGGTLTIEHPDGIDPELMFEGDNDPLVFDKRDHEKCWITWRFKESGLFLFRNGPSGAFTDVLDIREGEETIDHAFLRMDQLGKFCSCFMGKAAKPILFQLENVLNRSVGPYKGSLTFQVQVKEKTQLDPVLSFYLNAERPEALLSFEKSCSFNVSDYQDPSLPLLDDEVAGGNEADLEIPPT
jgi:hypothetical protein